MDGFPTLDFLPKGDVQLKATIRVDPSSVEHAARRLEPYKHLPDKLRPALGEVADYVRDRMIPDTFKKEGPGWAPLAPRTISERTLRGFPGSHPILIRTGDLLNELTERAHPKHVEVIKTGKYARIEVGGSSLKFIRNQQGDPTLRIPSRPMIPGSGGLPVAEDDKVEIGKIIKSAIAKEQRKSLHN